MKNAVSAQHLFGAAIRLGKRVGKATVCLIPLGAWVTVIMIRILVEGPIENALASSKVIGGYDLIRSLGGDSQNRFDPTSAVQIAKRGSSFAVYGTLAFLYIGFAVAVAASGSLVVGRTLVKCKCWRWQKALPLLGCGLALCGFVFASRSHSTDFVLTWKGFGDFLRSFDPTGWLRFWVSLTKIATSFGFIASFVLLALSCVILLPEQKDSALRLELHRQRIEILDLVLVLGTALFVFALIRDRAFFIFADSLISKDGGGLPSATNKSAVMYLADGIITVNGIYFSILTAAIYLPCAFILNSRTYILVPARVRGLRFKEREEWLGKHGLDRSLKDHCLRAATVLVPAVTGGATGLIQAFGGK